MLSDLITGHKSIQKYLTLKLNPVIFLTVFLLDFFIHFAYKHLPELQYLALAGPVFVKLYQNLDTSSGWKLHNLDGVTA